MNFQWVADGLQAAARLGSDSLQTADRGSGAKCRFVLYFPTGVVAVVIGVRVHFSVACWRTMSGRMEGGRSSVEALEQSRTHLEKSNGESLRNSRDLAMISILLGCGLGRPELSSLQKQEIQIRQGHWAIVDLVGKGGHIRTVPMPIRVKDAVDRWMLAAKVAEGSIFRAVSRHGSAWGSGVTESIVWYAVRDCARRLQLERHC
jgi:hypothetical protein